MNQYSRVARMFNVLSNVFLHRWKTTACGSWYAYIYSITNIDSSVQVRYFGSNCTIRNILYKLASSAASPLNLQASFPDKDASCGGRYVRLTRKHSCKQPLCSWGQKNSEQIVENYKSTVRVHNIFAF